MEVYLKNFDKKVSVNGGESLMDLWRANAPAGAATPICAKVNNKTEPLCYQVFAPKQVEFIGVEHPSGRRVYVRSLSMMLYKAVTELYPGTELKICHSIAGGYLCKLQGVEVTEQVVSDLEAAMHSIAERDIEFVRHEELTRDVIEIFRRQGLADKVALFETIHELYTVYYTLDGLADSYYGPLAPSTGLVGTFALRPYHRGFLLMPPARANLSEPEQPVAHDKMYAAFRDYVDFNHIIGVSDVGSLNRSTLAGRSADLINVAEALHDKKIAAIADEIARRYAEGGARIVLIAGPSSSGKTTTAKRLSIYLMTNLLRPKMISLDDYFVNREATPRDIDGDYDFESLYALDLEQFNADLNALLEGREIDMPTYNFTLGKRQYLGNKLRLDPHDVLVIEGIHGLNPELTASIEERMKFRVYVSALTTLAIDDHNWVPTTDNRLLRRIVRDHKYRGTSALETIKRWPSVRRGEERWIFPYQENADVTFNSSLIFELAVMKPYADELLRNFPNDVPQYAEAYRLRKFLSYFIPIEINDIPPTSLLREFLGGSSFKY
ncbi:MAG: nucleoside kinase [Muribaculaceae bacterium]|nr:nucleoside kinase [Muribaculaceae bacterium]